MKLLENIDGKIFIEVNNVFAFINKLRSNGVGDLILPGEVDAFELKLLRAYKKKKENK